MLCICDSQMQLNECCNKIIQQHAVAQTPLALMRSRYFAFAKGITDYLVASHSKLTREPEMAHELNDWCSVTNWTKLVVHSFDSATLENSIQENYFTRAEQQLPTVCFSAFYCYNNEFYMMKELSRFIVEDGRWRYLNGDAIEHINFGRVGLNTPCPCNSGLKFKRCCNKRINAN